LALIEKVPPLTTPRQAGLAVEAASEPDVGHRDLLDGQFWRRLPGYRLVDEPQFLDGRWQARGSVTRLGQLREVLGSVVPDAFYRDVEAALRRAPMSLRLSPYVVALIDWKQPVADPLRRQFVPLASELRPDHPRLCFDSLCERADAPVPGLVHRYTDRALFLALDTCPVYCRFCTRSYAVGMDTETVDKHRLGVSRTRWEQAFAYLADRPELEDVIVSGGDAYQLRADELRHIGDRLLAIPHIRRIRLATRGLAVMPMRILSDAEWLSAVADLVHRGRALHKQVMIHTHFNYAREITAITKRALDRLFELGMTVRNQTVLLRGVNDDAQAMRTLVKRLGYVNVQPYYVYLHDMVAGVEDLRTPLSTAIALTRGIAANRVTGTMRA